MEMVWNTCAVKRTGSGQAIDRVVRQFGARLLEFGARWPNRVEYGTGCLLAQYRHVIVCNAKLSTHKRLWKLSENHETLFCGSNTHHAKVWVGVTGWIRYIFNSKMKLNLLSCHLLSRYIMSGMSIRVNIGSVWAFLNRDFRKSTTVAIAACVASPRFNG